MKTQLNLTALCLLVLTMISGCEVVGGIFKAGVWVGILAVVLVIAVIFWLVGKARK